jgi:hypothetical protein
VTAPTLLFGVGATKAGTTWLWRWLEAHPECHVSRDVKEAHFFDSLDRGYLPTQLRTLDDRRAALRARITVAHEGEWRDIAERLAAIDALEDAILGRDLAAYLAWLGRGAGDARVLADITPAYGLLSAARLAGMAGLAARVRFVYLLRDPVERLWSHLRMVAARRATDPAGQERARARLLDDLLGGGDRGGASAVRVRCDYAGTLDRLSALPSGSVLILPSDELFSDAGIARLCRFLNIGFRPGRYAEQVHPGPPVPMAEADRRRARAFLAPQYRAVERHLGHLPAGWAANEPALADAGGRPRDRPATIGGAP